MIEISSTYVVFDSESKRVINEANQQLNVEECLLTKEEIVRYTAGKDFSLALAEEHGFKEGDTILVYRSLDEIKKSLPYHRMIPLLYDHKMIDSYTLEQVLAREEEIYSLFDQKDEEFRNKRLIELEIEIIGTMGSSPFIRGEALFNCLAVWTDKGQKAINAGKRKLSVGFLTDYVRDDGEFNGQPFHFRQTNIRCNHVTICYIGRCDDAVVADSLSDFLTNSKGEADNMKVTAEQNKAYTAAVAQDNADGGNTMPIITKTIGEVTKGVQDSKDEDCKTMDTDTKEDKKAEDTVEQPESEKKGKEKTAEDTESESKSENKKAEDEDTKEDDKKETKSDKAEDSITMTRSQLSQLVRQVKNEVKQEIAMDSVYANDVKHKLSDLGFSAMDSVSPSVALDACLKSLGKNVSKLAQSKKSFDEKKLVLDSIHADRMDREAYMDETAMDSISSKNSVSDDDLKEGA